MERESKLDGRETLLEKLQCYVGKGGDTYVQARDPITLEGIRQMVESVGDQNPVYTDPAFAAKSIFGGIIAPPYSLLSWSVRNWEFVKGADWVGSDGVRRYRQDSSPRRTGDSQGSGSNEPLFKMLRILERYGYTSVAVTNGEVEFAQQFRPGQHLRYSTHKVKSVVGPKKTSLGEGYFWTSTVEVRDQDEQLVCRMHLTSIFFKPAADANATQAVGRR